MIRFFGLFVVFFLSVTPVLRSQYAKIPRHLSLEEVRKGIKDLYEHKYPETFSDGKLKPNGKPLDFLDVLTVIFDVEKLHLVNYPSASYDSIVRPSDIIPVFYRTLAATPPRKRILYGVPRSKSMTGTIQRGKRRLLGLFKEDGTQILKPRYDEMSGLLESDYRLYRVNRKGKVGLVTSAGKVLIKTRYRKIEVADTNEDLFIVEDQKGKQQIIDENQRVLFDADSLAIHSVDPSGRFVVVEKDNHFGVMTMAGELIEPVQWSHITVPDADAEQPTGFAFNSFNATIDPPSIIQFRDAAMQTVDARQFDGLMVWNDATQQHEIADPQNPFRLLGDGRTLTVSADGIWAVIDWSGKILVPAGTNPAGEPCQLGVLNPDTETVPLRDGQNGLWGMLETILNNPLILPKYKSIQAFEPHPDGMEYAKAWTVDGRKVYVDIYGNETERN